jgi:hypothetical protein
VGTTSLAATFTLPNGQLTSKWDRLGKHLLLINPNPASTSVVVVNAPVTGSIETAGILTTAILDEFYVAVYTESNGETTTYTLATSPVLTTFYTTATGKPAERTGSSLRVGAIIGATLGVVFGVTLFCGLALFFFRRKKRRAEEKASIEENADTDVKAQLHSEDVKPVRKELQGDQPPGVLPEKGVVVAELPANEIVGSEMEAAHELKSGRAE